MNGIDAQIDRLEKVCEQINSVLRPKADSERQEHPPTPLPLAGGLPDFGRDTARAKTYTAEIHWDVVNRDWYSNCAKCDADLGSIDESDIGHYVTCDCCATDNFIERED